MKLHSILAALLLAVSSLTAVASESVVAVFTEAPQRIFPLLDRNTRLDMIDYYRAGMKNESQNNLGGGSRIARLDPELMEVKMSDASDVTIFCLDSKGDTIVGVITTVAMPARDSRVAFYGSDWQKIDNMIAMPALKDWMADPSRQAEVEMVVPFMVAEYSFDPSTSRLTMTNNLQTFLSDDIYEMVAPLMKQKLVYAWNGKKFNLVR